MHADQIDAVIIYARYATLLPREVPLTLSSKATLRIAHDALAALRSRNVPPDHRQGRPWPTISKLIRILHLVLSDAKVEYCALLPTSATLEDRTYRHTHTIPSPSTPVLAVCCMWLLPCLISKSRIEIKNQYQHPINMQANSSLVLLFLAFLLFHTISRRLGISRSRSRLRNEHGCQSPRRYPHSEPILGLDYFFRSVKAFSQKKLLVQHEFDFARLGPTFVINNIGNDRIVTKDPQNIQAILKGGLDEWGIESLRRLSMEPFSGEKSFFIRDDAVLWRTSRNQIKPALAKAEFGKFQDLEIYVARFLDLCPKTGETVDISSLFERLVCILKG